MTGEASNDFTMRSTITAQWDSVSTPKQLTGTLIETAQGVCDKLYKYCLAERFTLVANSPHKFPALVHLLEFHCPFFPYTAPILFYPSMAESFSSTSS